MNIYYQVFYELINPMVGQSPMEIKFLLTLYTLRKFILNGSNLIVGAHCGVPVH